MKIYIDDNDQGSLEMMNKMIASNNYDKQEFLMLAEHFAAVMVGRYREVKENEQRGKINH